MEFRFLIAWPLFKLASFFSNCPNLRAEEGLANTLVPLREFWFVISAISFTPFTHASKSFGIKKSSLWAFSIPVSFLRDNLSLPASRNFSLTREAFLAPSFKNCVCSKSNNNGSDFTVRLISSACMDSTTHHWTSEALSSPKLTAPCSNILPAFMHSLYVKFFIFKGSCGFVRNEHFFLWRQRSVAT